MPSPRVRADHDSLAAMARLFGQEAANTHQTLRHLRRQMDALQNGDWIGRGATAFYQEMNGAVLPSLQRLATSLEVAGRVAAKTSEIMRAAEEEAAAAIRLGIEGGGAAMMGGAAASSGAEDDDLFADVYAALGRERSGGADDEDIFAGVNIGAPAGGAGDAGGAGAGAAAGPASPETPSGGAGGERRRGQGGVGGVGGASLGGGEVGPEKNPFAQSGSSADEPSG
jgi:WXG100 family type VII secretion target